MTITEATEPKRGRKSNLEKKAFEMKAIIEETKVFNKATGFLTASEAGSFADYLKEQKKAVYRIEEARRAKSWRVLWLKDSLGENSQN